MCQGSEDSMQTQGGGCCCFVQIPYVYTSTVKHRCGPFWGSRNPEIKLPFKTQGSASCVPQGTPPWAVLCLNRSHLKIWCPQSLSKVREEAGEEPGMGSSFPSHLPSLLLQPSAHTHPMPFLPVRP